MRAINYIIYVGMFLFIGSSLAQNDLALGKVITYEEYIGYVKQHHPLVKQAELVLSQGEANLLKARGGFDPKIEVDYDRKKFKKTEYYDQLNTAFKIPTWYGIELKATFEENTGEFLNPNLTVPEDGLYSAGVSFSLAQGLLINERMATLKKARFFELQTKADRDLLVNQVIYDASLAYFEWFQATTEREIYSSFLINATTRLDAITRSVEEGDKAAIDIVEARITAQDRKLNLEAVQLSVQKARLAASTYLWMDGIPLELNNNIAPFKPDPTVLDESLQLISINLSSIINSHPKLASIDAKINALKVDRYFKKNQLLPKVDLQYNFLSPENDRLNSFNTSNYKAFLNLSFPLFLRKERGALKLAQLKVNDVTYEREATTLTLENKIKASVAEISSLTRQYEIVQDIVVDYETLVAAEERKFMLGESSLFLINSREQKLIESKLKATALATKELIARAKLFNTAGL